MVGLCCGYYSLRNNNNSGSGATTTRFNQTLMPLLHLVDEAGD